MHVFLEKIHIKPEHHATLMEALIPFIEKTRTEKGCRHAAVYRDEMDPDAYIIVEEWETQADFDAHLKMTVESGVGEVLRAAVDRPSQVEIHEVAKTSQLGVSQE